MKNEDTKKCEKWFDKANYKKVALDRFLDAIALYSAERYEFSFYTCGYVLEIGAKAKMAEFAKREVSVQILKEAIERAENEQQEEKDKNFNIVNDNNLEKWKNIIENCSTSYTETPYAFFKNNQEEPLFKKLGNKNALLKGQPSFNHDPASFLRIVGKWCRFLGEGKDYCDKFKKLAENFKELKWATDLRYGELKINDPDNKAKKALTVAYCFLQLLSYNIEEEAKLLVMAENLKLDVTCSDELNKTLSEQNQIIEKGD